MKEIYIYPQEKWDRAKCAKMAKRRDRDGYGTLGPWPGKISDHASPYPGYGLIHRYNPGQIVDGELYRHVSTPLPEVHEDFEIINRRAWGWYIQLKEAA